MNNVKGRHFGGEIALWAVRGYCRYPIGCRGPDVQHDEYRSRRHLPSDVVPVLRSFGEDCLKPLVNIRDRQQRRQRHQERRRLAEAPPGASCGPRGSVRIDQSTIASTTSDFAWA